MQTRRVSMAEASLVLALFVIAISAPLLKQITRGEPETIALEHRHLAEKPKFSWRRKTLNAFPAKFEQYYNDHFGFRTFLLGFGNQIKVRLFNLSASPNVVIGREHWLYYFEPALEKSFRGELRLSDEQLAQWARALERRRAWLAARHVKYLFVAVPEKQTIYPEFVPAHLPRGAGATPFDQLAELCAKLSPPIEFVDLRPALRAGKNEQRIYLKNDTHWNTAGAYLGYRETVSHIAKWFPKIAPRPLADFPQTRVHFDSGDLARLAGVPTFAATEEMIPNPETNFVTKPLALPADAEQPTERPPFFTRTDAAPEVPRVLFFRDSFTQRMSPFLSSSFAQCDYVWRWKFNDVKLERALASLVEKEKPDLFVDEMVERFFTTIPDEHIIFGGEK